MIAKMNGKTIRTGSFRMPCDTMTVMAALKRGVMASFQTTGGLWPVYNQGRACTASKPKERFPHSLARFYHSEQAKSNAAALKFHFPSDAAVRFTVAIVAVASAVRL
jgi:hypothetical protein